MHREVSSLILWRQSWQNQGGVPARCHQEEHLRTVASRSLILSCLRHSACGKAWLRWWSHLQTFATSYVTAPHWTSLSHQARYAPVTQKNVSKSDISACVCRRVHTSIAVSALCSTCIDTILISMSAYLGIPREDLAVSILFVASRAICCSMHVAAADVAAADVAADLTILDCLHGHCCCDSCIWDTCYCDICSSFSFSNDVSNLKRHLWVRDKNNSSYSSSSLPRNYCSVRTCRSSSSWCTFSLSSRSKRSTGVS